MTIQLPRLVTGPHRLDRHDLVVEAGSTAVILHNGNVWGVRTAGRSTFWSGLLAAERALPWTGQLSYLLFVSAPMTVELNLRDILLNDGRRVGVTCTARIRPVWLDDPSLLLSLVNEYGVHSPDSYTAVAAAQLDADFRAGVARELARHGHGEIVREIDPRATLNNSVTQSDLLGVSLINPVFTLDGTEIELEQITREAELRQARLEAETKIFAARTALETVRAEHAVRLQRINALGQAEIDSLAAETYQVHPWRFRHPELHQQLDLAQGASLQALITEYADTIPFLAEAFDLPPAQLLSALLNGETPRSGPRALTDGGQTASAPPLKGADQTLLPAPRWTIHPALLEHLDFAPELTGLSGAASGEAAVGDGRALFLVGVGGGLDTTLPLDSPYWRSYGYRNVTLCLAREHEDVTMTGQALLCQIAAACGLDGDRSRVRVVAGGSIELELRIGALDVDVDGEHLAVVLQAWITALEELFTQANVAARITLTSDSAL